ncbi:MAG: hypothetical protein LBM93_02915 [Oscillospiraceae bacterium]|jgi:hypothetical protein|nr:hypothetical protein [Oscillospiraceae bacterium]
MLKNIDITKLTDAIKQTYKTSTEASAENIAKQLIEQLDILLEPALSAWIYGEPVPDITVDKYSVNKILKIRNSSDYLEAFKLLSEYKNDPVSGEKHIWKPIRGKR